MSFAFTLSDEDKKLLPTDEEVRSYREHGWYITRKILSDEEVDALIETSERF